MTLPLNLLASLDSTLYFFPSALFLFPLYNFNQFLCTATKIDVMTDKAEKGLLSDLRTRSSPTIEQQDGSTPVDLNKNVEAKISNPLAHIPTVALIRDVEQFAQENQLSQILPQLKKGALLARDPAAFEDQELDDDEKEVLRIEIARKWKHPFKLYFTIVVCSIGAAVQGWDQTGSNGANLSFPREFGIGAGSKPPGTPNHDRDNWLVGLVNAGPYIGSAFIGCWLSDPANNYLGTSST